MLIKRARRNNERRDENLVWRLVGGCHYGEGREYEAGVGRCIAILFRFFVDLGAWRE